MKTTLPALGLLFALNAIAQPNYSPNKIFYQDRISEGNFRLSNENKTYHLDANGDGVKDIVAVTGSELYVYTALGNGHFKASQVSVGSYNLNGFGTTAAADLNQDGKIDFVWYNEKANDMIVSYWLGNGSDNVPTYTTPTPLHLSGLGAIDSYWGYQMGLYGVNTADIDGDGDVDILGFGPNGIQRPHMIINNGDNTFTRFDLHTDPAYQSYSQVTDWNGDGRLDVLVPENGNIMLYTNEGNSGTPSIPHFSKSVLVDAATAGEFDSNGSEFDLVDLNQDGRKDIVLNGSAFDFSTYTHYHLTRILINTTTAAPAYSFAATEMLRDFDYPFAVLGGSGARYQDVDGNGVLDIIGVTGKSNTTLIQLSVNLLNIDAQNVVSATQAPLISNGPLTHNFGEASLSMLINDIDGDNQPDYVLGYSNQPNVVSYRTRFPSFTQTETHFPLQNKVLVGGKNSDQVTLTINVTGGGGSFFVPSSNGAIVTGDGSLSLTIQGTVEQINVCLADSYFIPAQNATYQLNFGISNTFGETFTNSLSLIQGGITLPVQGLIVNATKKAGAAEVTWQTLSEKDAMDFLVQHSQNGTSWTTIGNVTANGNSTSSSYYRLLHQQPVKGTNYYRLIQRDTNRKLTYSKVVTVAWNTPGNSLAIYPNPVVGKMLSVVLEEAATVQLYDARGVMLLQQKMEKGVHQLNLSGFAGGMYLIRAGLAQQMVLVP